MTKRLFDLIVASVLLLALSPVMLAIAIALRLDSPGPVVYASPRVGKGGRIFGFYRFRTVDLRKPAHLHMRERLTGVGRIIRQLSLDDLPNLFNILVGDLSIIGPRPTEPERVDLADPTWRQILSVRPGLVSPAIWMLARRYNASPPHIKQQFELDYTQSRSIAYDLKLFLQGIWGQLTSKGNWKARGTPQVDLDYTTYQPSKLQPGEKISENPARLAWQPLDLKTVAGYVQCHGSPWPVYRPQFGLIPHGENFQQPAIFIVITDIDDMQTLLPAELHCIRWPIVENNRYLCLGAVLYFEHSSVAISGESEEKPTTPRRQVLSTVLDVATPEVETWFSTWRHMPEAPWLFILTSDLRLLQQISLSPTTSKQEALAQWETAKYRLHQSDYALDNFLDERRILLSTLPHRTTWETTIHDSFPHSGVGTV